MKFTISKIVKEQIVPGKYGPQSRTAFTTAETGTDVLSAFSKYPLKGGQQIEGEIENVEKDGKTFHNFKFQKKDAAPANQALIYISRNVDAALATGQQLISKLDILVKRLEAKGVLDDISVGNRRITPALKEDMAENPDKYLTDEFPPVEAYENEQ